MSQQPPVILVDGSSYLYRAYHALPPLMTSQGQPTGAIKGVSNMLQWLVNTYHPLYMVVIFDAKGKTFRNDLYSEYKATRPPMPDDLREQIEPLHQLVEAMGFPLIVAPGVEADDVIGTLAVQLAQQGQQVLISTGDKDMAQLVNEQVTLINTMNNQLLDTAGVEEKFGVRPEQIIDYLALMGDKVDNVPGVEKCGPKTAVKWLDAYHSLDNLLAHADEIKGKVGENLRAAVDQLPLSKELVTIKLDCEVPQHLEDLKLQPQQQKVLIELCKHLEFKAWLGQLLGSQGGEEKSADSSEQAAIDRSQYQTLLEWSEFETWLEELQQAELVCFDTETTSLNGMQAELVGISFSLGAGRACYIPVAHEDIETPTQLERVKVLQALKPLFEDESKPKLGQNLKYDMGILANYGIALKGVAHDTMLQSYVLDSVATRHDMDSLSLKYLGYKPITFEDVAGKGAKQITFDRVPVAVAAEYAAEDADITLKLHKSLWPKLQQQPSLQSVYSDIEMPLVPVLSRIERNGAAIDCEMLQQQSKQLAEEMAQLEQQAFALAGEEFNLSSPKQLGVVLYEKLGIPVIKKTPKGAPSTAEAVLQELALEHELPKIIMKHRGCHKLKNTYTDKLPKMVDLTTGRIHTSYHQAVTSTGRLSSSDPNLQNIPVRSESGRRIRQAFRAEPGNIIVAADYSQIELRIMAHLSQDPSLLKAFAAGEDIHRATAAEVEGIALDEVSTEQRRQAKAINFGLIYGMSAFGLAKQLGVGRAQAQSYIDVYFDRYPGVKAYMDNTRQLAADKGYVETLFGRRLYLPEINASNGMRRQAAERTAINAPMQGSAADIIKLAMIATDQWLASNSVDAKMIMQVHDELVFEVAKADQAQLIEVIPKLMAGAASLDVPLLVDVGYGDNWDEAH